MVSMTKILLFVLSILPSLAQATEDPSTDIPEDIDICTSCNQEEQPQDPEEDQKITVEIRINPVTGEITYVIKGIVLE